jgi:hypothetical protein
MAIALRCHGTSEYLVVLEHELQNFSIFIK